MTDIIEQVAKAIYAKRNGYGAIQWAHQTKSHKAPYLDDARAAIAELRKASPAIDAALSEAR